MYSFNQYYNFNKQKMVLENNLKLLHSKIPLMEQSYFRFAGDLLDAINPIIRDALGNMARTLKPHQVAMMFRLGDDLTLAGTSDLHVEMAEVLWSLNDRFLNNGLTKEEFIRGVVEGAQFDNIFITGDGRVLVHEVGGKGRWFGLGADGLPNYGLQQKPAPGQLEWRPGIDPITKPPAGGNGYITPGGLGIGVGGAIGGTIVGGRLVSPQYIDPRDLGHNQGGGYGPGQMSPDPSVFY